MSLYICKPKSRKWTITALSYILDMARINSQVIYVIKNKINTTISFSFGWELTKASVAPDMKRHPLKGGLSKPIQQLVSLFTGAATTAERSPPPDDNIPCRCRMYLNEAHGDGHKEAKKQLKSKKSLLQMQSPSLSKTCCFVL